MTFSSSAKAEICKLPIGKPCCAVAEAYGVFLYGNTFSASEIKIITECRPLGERLSALLQTGFDLTFDLLPPDTAEDKQSYVINAPDKLERIAATIGYDSGGVLAHHINFGILEDSCCNVSLIRGAFLAGGSVTDPDKGYHLELTTSRRSVSRSLFTLLMELGFSPKDAMRRGNYVIYFKQSGVIEDFLTTVGAPQAAMSLMTAKVEKDMRNAIQRRVNCDTANVDKSVEAAQTQLAAIRRIEQGRGLENLPDKLHQTALLRIVNPEASLAELSQLADPPVTKSCMSHRLKKLVMMGKEVVL